MIYYRLNKAKNVNTFVNEEEAYRVMQMMLDEPIEGFDIYKALRESETKGFKKGHEEGLEEGREEGRILQAVKMYRVLAHYNDKQILDAVMKDFNLSEQDAEKYMAWEKEVAPA